MTDKFRQTLFRSTILSTLFLWMVATPFHLFSQCTISQNTGNNFGNPTAFFQSFTSCGDGLIDSIVIYDNTLDYGLTLEVFEGESIDPADLIDSKVFADPIPTERVNAATDAGYLDISELNILLDENTMYTFKVTSTGGVTINPRFSLTSVYDGGRGGQLSSFSDLDWWFDIILRKSTLSLVSSNPAGNAFDVDRSGNIELTFDDDVDAATIDNIFVVGDKSGIIDGVTSVGATNQVIFNPDADFKNGEIINLHITNELLGENGQIAVPASIQFTASAGAGPGTFPIGNDTIVTGLDSPSGMDMGDINGDGIVDLVSGFLDDDIIAWFASDGNGNWTQETIATDADRPVSVDIADLNGDGRPDVLVANSVSDNVVWYNNDGTGMWPDEDIVVAGITTSDAIAGDIDNDGDLDVVASIAFTTTSDDDRKIAWYENDGMGTWTETDIFANEFDCVSLRLADMDNDNDLDVLAVTKIDDLVHWFENDEDGNWTRHEISSNLSNPNSLDVADFDNDGDMDVVSGATTDGVVLYVNDGGGTAWTTVTIESGFSSVDNLRAADMDGDGDLDILASYLSGGNYQIILYDNSDDGQTWRGIPVTEDVTNPREVLTADVDGDNDLDVISGSGGFTNINDDEFISVMENAEKTVTWFGFPGEFWNTADNWVGDEVPSFRDNVLIPTTPSNRDNPRIIDEREVANLTIESGASLEIFQRDHLTISGDLELDGALNVSRESSLILLGSVSGTGTANVTRSGMVGSDGLSMIGAPISDATVTDLGGAYNFTYDEVTDTYSTATGDLTPGEGIFIGFTNITSPSITFSGTLNFGQIDYLLSKTGSDDAFNIVSNPYASAIDRQAFIDANSGVIDGNIWLWDDGGENVGPDRGGDYIVVNNLGSISTVSDADGVAGSTGKTFANDAITATQGFYVNATAADDLTFTPDMQVIGNNLDANFFRGTDTDQEGDYLIRLSLSNENQYNEILVGLRDQATFETDFGLDAPKLIGNENIAFYSLIEEKPFVIQAIPKPEVIANSIKLGYQTADKGLYNIKVEGMGDFGEMTVYLLDKQNSQYYQLSEGIIIPIEPGKQSESADRFEMLFMKSNSQILAETDENETFNEILLHGSTSQLTIISGIEGSAQTTIHSIEGKLLYNENLNFEDQKADIRTDLKAGVVYILRVADQSVKFRLSK
ncbi:MAG: FG-GAP-like repeat-containing protein [Bacteroidota bacterium]